MSDGTSRGWVVVTIVAGAMLVLSAMAVVVQAILGNWGGAIMSALWAVASYWFAAGAWRRTPWGAPRLDDV